LQQHNIRKQIDRQNLEVNRNLLTMKLKQSMEQLAAIHAGVVISKRLDGASEQYAEQSELFLEYVKLVGETASTGEQRIWRAKLTTVSGEYIATFTAAEEILHSQMPIEDIGRQLEQQYGLSTIHK